MIFTNTCFIVIIIIKATFILVRTHLGRRRIRSIV